MSYLSLKEQLKSRPQQLEDVVDWLLLVVNTARAMIETSDPSRLEELQEFLACETTAEVQLVYDHFQGKYGRENFSYRRHPHYFYLSSLVALFPDYPLGADQKLALASFLDIDHYFLYEL